MPNGEGPNFDIDSAIDGGGKQDISTMDCALQSSIERML